MLDDPLDVTYDSNAKSLPRASGFYPVTGKLLDKSVYRTNDGEFVVFVTKNTASGATYRTEITLCRVVDAPDDDDFISLGTNGVGLVLYVDKLRTNTSVDIPLLRTALLSLVDSTLQGRLIGGEF